jgi:hypothetical protein
MVERRREPRVRVALRVQVSGVDTNCEGFSESVVATNLSQSGALLTKLGVELRCGNLIAVEYAGRQAHYRIVWVLDSGTQDGMQVAIHKWGDGPCPWEEVLPSKETVGRHS